MKNLLSKRSKNNTLKVFIVLFLLSISALFVKYESSNIYKVFSPNKELPIYAVDTEEKKVAISFDAAWGDKFTREILNILDEYDVKTTFFLVEFWVEKYPELVKEIDSRGHEIGNHSSNHPYMSKLNEMQIVDELKKTEDRVYELIGKKTSLFRPPFGDYNDRLINVCRENGYHVIQWNIDSLDWKERGVQPVVDRVVKNVDKGSIILFHNNAKYVSEYLPLVLEELKAKEYEIVPISELIYKDNYYIDHEGRQYQK